MKTVKQGMHPFLPPHIAGLRGRVPYGRGTNQILNIDSTMSVQGLGRTIPDPGCAVLLAKANHVGQKLIAMGARELTIPSVQNPGTTETWAAAEIGGEMVGELPSECSQMTSLQRSKTYEVLLYIERTYLGGGGPVSKMREGFAALPTWGKIALAGGGSLLVIGGGYVLYRKMRGKRR